MLKLFREKLFFKKHYSGLSSNAFGSNEFISNNAFDALLHLQSNDPKFISKGNYSGLPGLNFQLSADRWIFAAPWRPSLPPHHFQCCQIGLQVALGYLLCHLLIIFEIRYLRLFGLHNLAWVRFILANLIKIKFQAKLPFLTVYNTQFFS